MAVKNKNNAKGFSGTDSKLLKRRDISLVGVQQKIENAYIGTDDL